MKVLLVNGSPRPDSNTLLGLHQMEKIFAAQGIETEIFNIGNKDIRGCIACGRCGELGHCVFDDAVNEFAKKLEAAEDSEGMQTLRVLARNMSFLMKSIALGKEQFGLPEKETHLWTNFI